MGFIRNNNVWKINKILAGISTSVTPEDVQDMIDTSITPIETEIEGKQDTLTAGDGIAINDNTISLKDWELVTITDWTEYFDIKDNGEIFTKRDLIFGIKRFFSVNTTFVPKGFRINGTTSALSNAHPLQIIFISDSTSNEDQIVYLRFNSSSITTDKVHAIIKPISGNSFNSSAYTITVYAGYNENDYNKLITLTDTDPTNYNNSGVFLMIRG